MCNMAKFFPLNLYFYFLSLVLYLFENFKKDRHFSISVAGHLDPACSELTIHWRVG
jgi:hypothetical protein